mgnify:CR=1 FL=1
MMYGKLIVRPCAVLVQLVVMLAGGFQGLEILLATGPGVVPVAG